VLYTLNSGKKFKVGSKFIHTGELRSSPDWLKAWGSCKWHKSTWPFASNKSFFILVSVRSLSF